MKREKSPAYPAFGIGEAIEKAKKLYAVAKQHPVHPHVVHKALNYATDSGPALVAVSALKQFGLLDDQGRGDTRTLQLSKIAIGIVRDERLVSKERNDLIRLASKNPKIYSAIIDKYDDDFPSDEAMINELKMHFGFTDKAAPAVIRKFRETLDYLVGLDAPSGPRDGDSIVNADFELLEDKDMDLGSNDTQADTRKGQFSLPLHSGGRAEFVIDPKRPISKQESQQILSMVKSTLALVEDQGSSAPLAIEE